MEYFVLLEIIRSRGRIQKFRKWSGVRIAGDICALDFLKSPSPIHYIYKYIGLVLFASLALGVSVARFVLGFFVLLNFLAQLVASVSVLQRTLS